MAISSDLSIAIVLRSIFNFDFKEQGDKISMAYSSAIFPLHSTHWPKPLPSARSEFTYTYDWLISVDGKYAIFCSHDRSLTSQDPITISRIRNYPIFEVDRVKAICIAGEPLNCHTFCALHPHKPQLIFTAGGAVWLVDFEECTCFNLLSLHPIGD